jgi:hypothetical protein
MMGGWLQHIVRPGGYLEDFYIRKIIGADRFMALFEHRTHHFHETQREILHRILRENEGTLWGRDHKFSTLTPEDWSTQPINNYRDVEPYIERIRQGHLHALTAERPQALTTSTGTTAKPKLIPVTPSFLKAERFAQDVCTYLVSRNSGVDTSRILWFRGDAPNNDSGPLPFDSYPKLMVRGQRACVRRRYVLPSSLDYLVDTEHRLLIAGQAGFVHRPTVFIAVLPYNAIRIVELCDRYRRELYNATSDGRYIGTSRKIGRIHDREQVLRRIKEGHPLESLQLITTWIGGTQYLFVDELRRRGIDVPMRDLGLIATEGRFTIPMQNNTPHGVLNPFGPYYEFLTTDKKDIVPARELVRGGEYNLVITGLQGLYRYDMEDIIRVEDWYHETPIISFRRRDTGYSSIMGEKLHENHVVEFLGHLQVHEALMMAQHNPPGYVLYLRDNYGGPVSPEEMDQLLCRINFEYAEHRLGDRIRALEVRRLSDSQFADLDRRINPRQDHDRFKRRYLVSLADQVKIPDRVGASL